MSDAIVKHVEPDAPIAFGQKAQIDAIRRRIVSMIPGASEAPADVIWAAAQLAVMHQLNPFNGEIYIAKMGSRKVGNAWVDEWRALIGVKGLRKKAREQALFMTEERELDREEVKRLRRADYHGDDIGVEVTLYRMDIAAQCKHLGIEYRPVKSIGFWRGVAKTKQDGTPIPDNIPNTWTAYQVAAKRAEVDAIKKAFDLTLNVADPAMEGDEDIIDGMSRQIGQYERDHAIMQASDQETDENGDVLWAN